MARFNLPDSDRLKLAELEQATALNAGTAAAPLNDLTKLRWRGGALDFSKHEQIAPPPEAIHKAQPENAAEPAFKTEIPAPPRLAEASLRHDAPEPPPLAEISVPEPPASVINWRVWGSAIALLLISIAGVTIAIRPVNHAMRALHLELSDHDGQLEIRWDPRSDLVQQTADAKLSILDGAERLIVTLNPAQLRRGTALYARRSPRVVVRMMASQTDGKIAQETSMFQSDPAPETARTTLTAASKPQSAEATGATPVPQSQPMAPALEPSRPIVRGAQVFHPARAKPMPTSPPESVAAPAPLAQSGITLPFTCSPGDTFHKSDAPPGWDTFTCRARNLWSIVKTPRAVESSASER
jgi:hypothetical protein